MAEIYRSDIVRVDLDHALLRKHVGAILVTGDKLGNRFGAEIFRDGQPVDVTGCGVTAYFMRPGEDAIVLNGTASGSVAYVDLAQACYSKASSFTLTIKISYGGATTALRVIDGYILLTQTDDLVDPGEVVPTLDDIFAQIAAMETATERAQAATAEAIAAKDNANGAAVNAVNIATEKGDQAIQLAQEEADKQNEKIAALSEDLVSISQAVNMFDKTAVVDGYVNYESGAVNPLSGNKATDYIPVKPNSTIVLINFQTAASDLRGMAFYNSAKHYVGGIQYTSTGDIVFEVPIGVYYIRATIYASEVDYGCIVSKYDATERACPSYTDLLVKTLCIGDSLTVGADYTSGEYGGNMKENYPYYLGKLTGNEVDYIATAGFSAKNWWDKNQNNDFSAYDSAIIWLGTNEGLLHAGYVDLSTNTGCYGAIIKKLITDNPNIKIFLCKVKHSSGDAAVTNRVISNLAQAYHTGVIDIPSSDLWDAENMAIYHPNNNVHFSKVGNHALANFIKSEMDKYIASNLSSFNDLILGHGA